MPDRRAVLGQQEQQCPGRQLPEAELKQEEGAHRIGGRGGERQRNRRRQREQRGRQALPATQPEREQEREDQVVLLLHPQRPGMGEAVELGSRREIVGGGGEQHEVAEAEEGRQPGALAGAAQPGIGDEHHRQQRCDHKAHGQGRHDPQHAAGVELQHEAGE